MPPGKGVVVSALGITQTPAAGRMIDRYGGRDVLATTNPVFALGLVLLSFATGPITLVVAWLVLGAGMGELVRVVA